MRLRAAVWLAALAALAGVAAGAVAFASGGGDRGRDGGDASGPGVRGRVVPCGLIHERAAPCARREAGGGAVVLVRRGAGRPSVARVRADARGDFRVRVEPGSYVVEARMAGAPGHRSRPLGVAVVVPEGGWATVVLLAGRPAAGRAA